MAEKDFDYYDTEDGYTFKYARGTSIETVTSEINTFYAGIKTKEQEANGEFDFNGIPTEQDIKDLLNSDISDVAKLETIKTIIK